MPDADEKDLFDRGDYGLYRNSMLNKCIKLIRQKDYASAFECIAQVIFIDLSGLGNGEHEVSSYLRKSEIIESMMSNLPSRDHPFMIAPFVIGYLDILQDKLGLNDSELADHLLVEFNRTKLPRQLFTNDQCSQITMLEMREEKTKLRTFYAESKKCMKQAIRDLKAMKM